MDPDIQAQSKNLWAMLDDMAKNDPAGYEEFVLKQKAEVGI